MLRYTLQRRLDGRDHMPLELFVQAPKLPSSDQILHCLDHCMGDCNMPALVRREFGRVFYSIDHIPIGTQLGCKFGGYEYQVLCELVDAAPEGVDVVNMEEYISRN